MQPEDFLPEHFYYPPFLTPAPTSRLMVRRHMVIDTRCINPRLDIRSPNRKFSNEFIDVQMTGERCWKCLQIVIGPGVKQIISITVGVETQRFPAEYICMPCFDAWAIAVIGRGQQKDLN